MVLRIGLIAGKVDGDCAVAPGIPESHWVSKAASRREEVHSDVAIWWYVTQHFPEVQADLIDPREVCAERLQSNDINLLLGWDAVSAHMEEFGAESASFEPGHAERTAELLRAKSSKVWPPGIVQDLVNLKSNYHKRAAECGIPLAPTIYHTVATAGTPQETAGAILERVKELGWKKVVAKPVPSSWCRGVESFTAGALHQRPQRFENYFVTEASATEILVQESISGLASFPETRCFFYGGEFLYAVANSKHQRGGKKVEITDCPESGDGGGQSSGERTLPSKYWLPAKAIGERVQKELLPELRGFQGQKLSSPFPWLTRVDVGVHTGGLHDAEQGAEWPKGKPKHFLNEIEIVPTYYIANKFGHSRDFIAVYAAKMVQTAAEVTGIKIKQSLESDASDDDDLQGRAVGGSSPKRVRTQ